MLNYTKQPEEASSPVVWLAIICPESGASIPLFPRPNLTVLKHLCALDVEQKPHAANAKLINRNPAVWASEWRSMPGRKYSARLCLLWQNFSGVHGTWPCWQTHLPTYFCLQSHCSPKNAWVDFNLTAPGTSVCYQNCKLMMHNLIVKVQLLSIWREDWMLPIYLY